MCSQKFSIGFRSSDLKIKFEMLGFLKKIAYFCRRMDRGDILRVNQRIICVE